MEASKQTTDDDPDSRVKLAGLEFDSEELPDLTSADSVVYSMVGTGALPGGLRVRQG